MPDPSARPEWTKNTQSSLLAHVTYKMHGSAVVDSSGRGHLFCFDGDRFIVLQEDGKLYVDALKGYLAADRQTFPLDNYKLTDIKQVLDALPSELKNHAFRINNFRNTQSEVTSGNVALLGRKTLIPGTKQIVETTLENAGFAEPLPVSAALGAASDELVALILAQRGQLSALPIARAVASTAERAPDHAILRDILRRHFEVSTVPQPNEVTHKQLVKILDRLGLDLKSVGITSKRPEYDVCQELISAGFERGQPTGGGGNNCKTFKIKLRASSANGAAGAVA